MSDEGLLVNNINEKYAIAVSNCETQIRAEIEYSYFKMVELFVSLLLRSTSVVGFEKVKSNMELLVQSNNLLGKPYKDSLKVDIIKKHLESIPEKHEEGDEEIVDVEMRPFNRNGYHIIKTSDQFISNSPIVRGDEDDYDIHYLHQNSYTSKRNAVWKPKNFCFTSDKSQIALYTHSVLPICVVAYCVNRIVHLEIIDIPIESCESKKITFDRIDNCIINVTMSHDGKYVAILTQDSVIVYDIETQKSIVHKFEHPTTCTLTCVSFSKDNSDELCVGSTSGHMYVMNTMSAEIIFKSISPNITPILCIERCSKYSVVAHTLIDIIIHNTKPFIIRTNRILSIVATDDYVYALTFDGNVNAFSLDLEKMENFKVPIRRTFEIGHPPAWYHGLTIHSDPDQMTILYPDLTFTRIKKNKSFK